MTSGNIKIDYYLVGIVRASSPRSSFLLQQTEVLMAKCKMPEGKKINEELARKYQERSAAARKRNNEKAKLDEKFQISSQKALAPIQASSLKELAQKADDILHDPEATLAEIKLAIEILIFLRDSSGQKPTDKQEITNTTPQIVVASESVKDKINLLMNNADNN